MLGGILKVLNAFYEFLVKFEEGYLEFFELVNSGELLDTMLSVVGWLPSECFAIVVMALGVAVVFRILGR